MFGAETRDAESLLPCPLLLYPIFPSQRAVELGVSLDPFFSSDKANLLVQQTAECPASAWFKA